MRPWLDHEINLLERMCREGHPYSMMARALRRSLSSTRWGAVRFGFATQRKRRRLGTQRVVVLLREDHVAALDVEAKRFGVHRGTLCRLLLETLALEPSFITNIIDYS
jgi:hypothetical protein